MRARRRGVDWVSARRLSADDDAVAAGLLLLVDVLVLGGAVGLFLREGAAGAAAVELDAVAGARDAVALAGAARVAG